MLLIDEAWALMQHAEGGRWCPRPSASTPASATILLACQKGAALFFARGNHIALRVEASPMDHALAGMDPAELVEAKGSSAGAPPH